SRESVEPGGKRDLLGSAEDRHQWPASDRASGSSVNSGSAALGSSASSGLGGCPDGSGSVVTSASSAGDMSSSDVSAAAQRLSRAPKSSARSGYPCLTTNTSDAAVRTP